MHALRLWNRARDAHQGRKGGQPVVRAAERYPRPLGLCRGKGAAVQATEPDLEPGGTGRYVYVDNFR